MVGIQHGLEADPDLSGRSGGDMALVTALAASDFVLSSLVSSQPAFCLWAGGQPEAQSGVGMGNALPGVYSAS